MAIQKMILNISFLRASLNKPPSARLGVERGWFRESVIQLKSPSGKTHHIQCTTWRDKKQVSFLHNCDVGASVGLSVMRHVKGGKRHVCISGPQARA